MEINKEVNAAEKSVQEEDEEIQRIETLELESTEDDQGSLMQQKMDRVKQARANLQKTKSLIERLKREAVEKVRKEMQQKKKGVLLKASLSKFNHTSNTSKLARGKSIDRT